MAMAAADLDRPPEGVVILPEPGGQDSRLDPRAWVEAVRRPTPRRLRRPVAEDLTEARELSRFTGQHLTRGTRRQRAVGPQRHSRASSTLPEPTLPGLVNLPGR